MAEFLIQGETLTAVADKIRSYTEESKYSINENAISNEGALAQDSVVVYYTEYVDSQNVDYTGVLEGGTPDDTFVGYGYLSNNDNVIVPVIYKDGTGEGPDLEEPFFYCGTAVVNGTTYDKWRKIETQWDGVFTWAADGKKYAYTNVIVLENGINPVDMPQRIVDVYNVGHAAGSTATDASIAEEVSEQTDLIAEIKAVANELPDATGGSSFPHKITIKTSGLECTPEIFYGSESVIIITNTNFTKAYTDTWTCTDGNVSIFKLVSIDVGDAAVISNISTDIEITIRWVKNSGSEGQ